MDLHLNDKTALVTGASRGIGLAAARTLAAEGMRVVGVARTAAAELKECGAIPVAADLSTPEGVERGVRAAVAELGGLDLLVNNVGGDDAYVLGGFLDTDEESWGRIFDLNLFSAVRVTRAALPSLLERGGVVVNVSSVGARMPHSGPIEYNTAKAALTAFGKALSKEFGPRGLRVNTVSPGPVRTAIWEAADGFGAKLAAAQGDELAEFLDRLPARLGLTTGRMVDPEEVGALIAFLASDHARSVTGADHLIEGGMVKTV
jgi:NAD(P)-dependent dehydrogenase (short-subunit alcohol dehydrogenase family)